MGATAVFFAASLVVLLAVDERRGMRAPRRRRAELEPIAGPASTYRHPDYLDEARHANLAARRAQSSTCATSATSRRSSRSPRTIRPVLESWAADPATILPYPVLDHHWQATLGRTVLDAFGAQAVPADRDLLRRRRLRDLEGALRLRPPQGHAARRRAGLSGVRGILHRRGRPLPRRSTTPRADSRPPPSSRTLERDRDIVAVYADLPYNATGWLARARPRARGRVEAAAARDVLVDHRRGVRELPRARGSRGSPRSRRTRTSSSSARSRRATASAASASRGSRRAPASRRVLEQIRSPYAPSQPAAQIARHVLERRARPRPAAGRGHRRGEGPRARGGFARPGCSPARRTRTRRT